MASATISRGRHLLCSMKKINSVNFANRREHASPARWVPTLYFAEGLPFYTVSLMALVFYQRVGVSNEVIALSTSLLLLPWSLKPLWSPFLEMYKSRKFFVVSFEFIGGLCLGLLALCLPLPGYFRYSIALLSIISLCASSHDIAADGLYIASLNPKQQSAYAGWQGGFFNVARFFSQGGLIILAGLLEARMPILRAWMIIFGSLGVMLVLLGLYHARVLPTRRRRPAFRQLKGSSQDLWGRGCALFSEAQHHSVAGFHFSVPRGRRTTGKNRSVYFSKPRAQITAWV